MEGRKVKDKMVWSERLFQKITGYIYFVQADRMGPIKIGIAKDVGKRLIGIQTSNPYPLRLLCFFPGNEEMEKEIHVAFYFVRLEGEWFLPHPKLLKLIEERQKINEKMGFVDPNPEEDFGDWTLEGDKWDDHRLMIKRLQREHWEKPEWQLEALAEEYSKYAILTYQKGGCHP